MRKIKYLVNKGTAEGTIVFIHGNSSSSTIFRNVLKDVNISQTKIAVDLPGHSYKDKIGDESNFSIKLFCGYLIKLIESIDDDILLVGSSLGGHLAIEIALKVKRLKGLVVFGTPPLKHPMNFEEAFLPIPEFSTFLVENPSSQNIQNIVDISIRKPEYREGVVRDFIKANGKARSELAKGIEGNKFVDEFEIFTNLRIPKYILIGAYDPIVNQEYLEEVKKQSVGKCTLISFEDCGHYLSVEDPEKFSKIIERIANEIF